tara:strand:- start:152 stop:658 length:507 start_codon:yes stop_codon:yes gene_type:complete
MNIERKWAMPSHNTFSIKPIDEFIQEHLPKQPSVILDPFANRPSDYRAITNDLNPKAKVQFHMDALEFLKLYEDNSIDAVLFDPPYSPRQLKECYEDIGESLHDTKSSVWANWKDEIARITKPEGVVLSFGWNTVGMGMSRGFEITDILLVSHGGMHNDTICVREVKI